MSSYSLKRKQENNKHTIINHPFLNEANQIFQITLARNSYLALILTQVFEYTTMYVSNF